MFLILLIESQRKYFKRKESELSVWAKDIQNYCRTNVVMKNKWLERWAYKKYQL